ncbi:MAG TPA: hypothetical protein VMR02_05050 [Terracidiphilus sp.]|jgi:hypothetical protein|nr:hypothetical protein [Terracidiphilus sp.]
MAEDTADDKENESAKNHSWSPNMTVGQVPSDPSQQSVHPDHDARESDAEPDPAEMAWTVFWRVVTNPHYSNGVMAIAIVMIFLSGLAYTIFSALQWKANEEAADATKSAADTAKETLWAIEGANITTKKPTFDIVAHRVLLPFGNGGHTTSGPATITVHEATFSADPQTGARKAAIEAHWETGPVDSIPTTEPNNSRIIAIPAVTIDGLIKGTQIVTIAGEINYDIGIPNAPTRAWLFCYSAHFNWNTKKSETDACMPSRIIPALKVIESYPNNGTHY